MNILFLSKDYPPHHSGGVGAYIYEMSKLLSSMGHKVFVITQSPGKPAQYSDGKATVFSIEQKPKFRISGLAGFMERLEYSYFASKKIKEVVLANKIDVIESCEARAEGFWYYLFKRKPPLIIKLHTPEGIINRLNQQAPTLDSWLIQKLEEWWIGRADRLVGLSRPITSLVRSFYRLSDGNIPIVSNPIDSNFFKPAGNSNGGKDILYVGRLEFRKGVHILLKSVPYVIKAIPQAKFIFVGRDCGMKPFLLRKAQQLNIKDRIEFIDAVSREELLGYYRSSTLCVVPSLWENQPYSILESMACGKPVIASSTGGISEIINDNTTGILVEPGSYLELADKIIMVLNDKKMQERLGVSARKYIEEEYASSKVAEENIEIYEGLCRK